MDKSPEQIEAELYDELATRLFSIYDDIERIRYGGWYEKLEDDVIKTDIDSEVMFDASVKLYGMWEHCCKMSDQIFHRCEGDGF